MAHSFKIRLSGDINDTLRKVESVITAGGGLFEGTAEQGSFHGRSVAGLIKGNYCCSDGTDIMITITDKPFIVPYSLIEAEIRNYFA